MLRVWPETPGVRGAEALALLALRAADHVRAARLGGAAEALTISPQVRRSRSCEPRCANRRVARSARRLASGVGARPSIRVRGRNYLRAHEWSLSDHDRGRASEARGACGSRGAARLRRQRLFLADQGPRTAGGWLGGCRASPSAGRSRLRTRGTANPTAHGTRSYDRRRPCQHDCHHEAATRGALPASSAAGWVLANDVRGG